jgi:small redox-active disulfide protein 2
MKVEILGVGCSRCRDLTSRVSQALQEMKLETEVEEVTEIEKILEHPILGLPALVIDGRVKSAGRVPPVEEIIAWIAGAEE